MAKQVLTFFAVQVFLQQLYFASGKSSFDFFKLIRNISFMSDSSSYLSKKSKSCRKRFSLILKLEQESEVDGYY